MTNTFGEDKVGMFSQELLVEQTDAKRYLPIFHVFSASQGD